jgi:ubiquinone biosynthesis protein
MNSRAEVQPAGAAGEARRLAAIARVAAAKGWKHYAARLGLGGQQNDEVASHRSDDAVRLREALEELGPTFVKFGQMLSQRDDLLPPALVAELRALQDRAGAFPSATARRIIEEDTGRAVEQLFATFDDQPMAAASMAQVHCATLPDGTSVIVKVQRPDIAATVEADVAVLRRASRLLASMPALRSLNLPELVEEFAATLRGELDFEQEGRNAERFAGLNRDEPLVYVPRIFWQATARRVLTMEHSSGHRLDRAAAPLPRPDLAKALMRLFLTHVFEHGVFHADPHPGNVFLLPDGRLCFHDFGAIGELSARVQESLRQLFLAVMARDAAWVASAYLGMGGATERLDRVAFTADLGNALDGYYRASGLGQGSFGAILQEFIGLGRRHHIRLLGETTMLMRAFAELESVVRRLDPQFNSLSAFQSYAGRLLKHALLPQVGIEHVAQTYKLFSAVREVTSEASPTLRRLMGRLERGEPLFDIRHHTGGSLERHLLHASNRLAFALIVAAIVVGSAILLAAHAGPHWAGLPLLGVVGFVVAGVLGVAWAVLALKSGKL